MRIAIDPVPVVVGMYAYVGELLASAVQKREDEAADALGRRLARQRGQADREAQKMVRALHGDVKTADKLLKKTGDVWKISQETDLVDLVILPRGEGDSPRAYVLLRPKELKPLLAAIRAAAVGAGEAEDVLAALDAAAEAAVGKPSDYLTFGFDPRNG